MSEPYGRCLDCELEFETEEETSAHRTETLEAAEPDDLGNKHSHTTKLTRKNLSKDQRIANDVYGHIQDALWELDNDLDATDDEIRDALQGMDLVDIWDNR